MGQRGDNGGIGRKRKRKDRSTKKKVGDGWPTGKLAKAVASGEPAPPPAPARPPRKHGPRKPWQPAAPRELATAPGAVSARKRKQEQRDRDCAVEEHGERAAAQLAPPKRTSEAAGASAANRAKAFAKPGRSDEAARQAANRWERNLVAEIVRQAGKDPLGAAAALGGALRHSKVRSPSELNRTRVCGMYLQPQIRCSHVCIDCLAQPMSVHVVAIHVSVC